MKINKDKLFFIIFTFLFIFVLFIGFSGISSSFLSDNNLNAQESSLSRKEGRINPKEALFYNKMENNAVQCQLCPRRCFLKPGEWGFCRARKNIDGKLYSMGYASPCAVHVDPIEKKPFAHFYPGTNALSIASAGCNMRCIFCQNWEISQSRPTETLNYKLTPTDLIRLAKKTGSKSIAYTYSEPTNFYEYMLDTAKIAKKEGIKNVYHSSGYINEKPLRKLCEYMDAACIDLKGFSEEFYAKMSSARLKPVLETLKVLKEEGIWLEIVTLVIPTKNDSEKMIKEMSTWIKNNLGENVPLSFSRFYPMHRLKNLPPTPIKTLERARSIAIKSGLKYVYIGNVPGHSGEDTYCPKCGKKLIDRYGYKILENNIKNGKCKFCNEEIKGVWNE